MNDDEQDPMLGNEEERAAYVQQINDMISQDVEQRRAQRMAEFLQTRDSKAIIIGMTGASSGMVGAIGDLGE